MFVMLMRNFWVETLLTSIQLMYFNVVLLNLSFDGNITDDICYDEMILQRVINEVE